MRRLSFALIPLGLIATAAVADVRTGAAAPDFVVSNAAGKPVKLSDYRGRPVVLEWNNPGCPFVQKHYGSGNMQAAQAAATKAGAVWLTINSGAPGKQGYMTAPEATAFRTTEKLASSEYLLDPKGVVGRLYGAKTTPHMYVVDPKGQLVYQGGIDDRPTSDVADIKGARNHVLAALNEVRAGKPVSVKESKPYGCSVKYPT